MAKGPPSSEAGPSNSTQSPLHRGGGYAETAPPTTSRVQHTREQPQAIPSPYQNASYGQPHTSASPQLQNLSSTFTPGYAYYSYPQNWNGAWQAYSYNPGPSASHQYAYQQANHRDAQPVIPLPPPAPQKRITPSPSPSPSPPPATPPFPNEWDRVIKNFLITAGLTQSLRGFEADIVVMSPEWEIKGVPTALRILAENLARLGQVEELQARAVDERKLSYVRFAANIEPQTPTSVTKDISQFLARNRARNNASNRKEFLLSLGEKRRKLEDDARVNGFRIESDDVPSCARTDAKTQDRDIQMKYDIAKNEDGPLRKTIKPATTAQRIIPPLDKTKQIGNMPAAERYPAFEERLQNIETHLAIRYVPSPPRSVTDRIRFIEDHIMYLEKQFPPWAALHFNQPNRGWPAPPRYTPIIVPSHLTSTTSQEPTNTAQLSNEPNAVDTEDAKAKKSKTSGRSKSSLHRAVMERLEVQKAIDDLSGMHTQEREGRI